MEYAFLDSGDGQKLERFGDVTLIRPSPASIWPPSLPESTWQDAHASFSRFEGNQWEVRSPIPETWQVEIEGIQFKLRLGANGQVGVFPEQASVWSWMREKMRQPSPHQQPIKVLNLFAYSGGATIAAALENASVCHLDAAKGMVLCARENALLNGVEKAPIRWIVEDVKKFLQRAIRRNERYEAIILDPPTFGRGKAGEIFKIEKDLHDILTACRQLLSEKPLFVVLSCHTPRYSPQVLKQLLGNVMPKGNLEVEELVLRGAVDLPSGVVTKWSSLCN